DLTLAVTQRADDQDRLARRQRSPRQQLGRCPRAYRAELGDHRAVESIGVSDHLRCDHAAPPMSTTIFAASTCASERPSWLNTRLSQRGSRSSTTVERPTSGTTPST